MPHGRAGAGCKGQPATIAIGSAVLLTLCGFLVIFPALHGSALHPDVAAGVLDEALVQRALERYGVLARNMSQRIRTAELALQRLQRRQAAARRGGEAGQPPPTTVAAAAAPAPAQGSDGQGASKEEEKEEEEQETDEEREKRLKEEEKEQRQLIQYDEAAKTFRRHRPDFKCGNRVPLLPDGEVVECDSYSEYPCCSSLGWCGKSKEHCECELCSDYRSAVKVTFRDVKLAAQRRECDTIAHNLGKQDSPRACALLAVSAVECGRAVMFSQDYPDWGCRCCAAGTGAGSEEKAYWTVYTVEVDVAPAKGARPDPH